MTSICWNRNGSHVSTSSGSGFRFCSGRTGGRPEHRDGNRLGRRRRIPARILKVRPLAPDRIAADARDAELLGEGEMFGKLIAIHGVVRSEESVRLTFQFRLLSCGN